MPGSELWVDLGAGMLEPRSARRTSYEFTVYTARRRVGLVAVQPKSWKN